MEQKCPVCQSDATTKGLGPLNQEIEVICPICGHYVITTEAEGLLDQKQHMVASWLYYHMKFDESGKCKSIFKITESRIEDDDARCFTIEDIVNWYPRSFVEKADLFLELVAEKSEVIGNTISFSGKRAICACFGKFNFMISDGKTISHQADQFILFATHLREMGYLTPTRNLNDVILSAKGWIRVDELNKHSTHNKDIFVSMAFNDGTKDTREAIRAGIIGAGYSPEFIDEIIHNHQIMPEMFRLIRECKLLIMDVSDPNYGAYYEAGYALGLGKEVIITCREQEFHDVNNKPHFDIAQKQILVWIDYHDLTKKLIEWIKAIAG